jgi:hypothetical protein
MCAGGYILRMIVVARPCTDAVPGPPLAVLGPGPLVANSVWGNSNSGPLSDGQHIEDEVP